MKVAASTVAPPPSSTIVKMEDRKRTASQSVDELAPPTKRQAVNGASKASADSDMPWKDDLERYQKDAIYRQMLEYKREKATLEAHLKVLQKRSVDHDDHLRVIDAWWSQLLDEVKLLCKNEAPTTFDISGPFPTALHFKTSTEFADHLSKRAKDIKDKIGELFNRVSSATPPDVEELQRGLANLLVSQKEQMLRFDRLRAEKEDLGERLETASLRYLKAEKRLDRAKSAAVARLEQQAYSGTGNHAGSGFGSVENGHDSDKMNGIIEDESKIEAAQLAHKEATAILEKQKEQLDTILSENTALTEQLTNANARLTNLSEDDYARTDLFKNFKAQHEEVIKRINHLEATNIQLREEAEKLQAERTAYHTQIKNEAETLTGEIEGQLERIDADLTRIRSARDELLADLSMRKASQEQERVAINHIKELVRAKDDRITSLELEVQRLRSQLGEQSCEPTPRSEIESLHVEELRRKYVALEQSFASVNNELPAMEKAYKRSMAVSSKKVLDFAALEEKVTILIAEKSKADQKYFAARKDMDIRIGEVRALRAQNAKSSEIIMQLKEVEASNRTLLAILEKQLSDLRQANNSFMVDNKRLEGSALEAVSKAEALKGQVSDLTTLMKSKDAAYSAAKQKKLALEADLEQLRVRFEQAQKEKATWKAKSLNSGSKEEDDLRQLALCTVCKDRFKDTALKTCGHVFCMQCIEDRMKNRMRKCPNCAKAFDKMDVMSVHM